MKDPLTKEEKDEFFKDFREEFDRLYEKALKQVPEEDQHGPGSYLLTKLVLLIVAEGYHPRHPQGQELLKHLQESI